MRKISYLLLSLFCTILMITSCNVSIDSQGHTITSKSTSSSTHKEDIEKIMDLINSSSSVDSTLEQMKEWEKSLNKPYDLIVTVLNVGQGDSILIQAPNGKTMLIDAGDSKAQSAVYDNLVAKKINKIDVLVVTHPHADHIGSMSYIINKFSIGSIYMPKATTTTKVYENLLLDIKNKGLQIHTAKTGVNISLDSSLQINIIAPIGSSYSNLNDYSAVVKMVYNNTSFLFAGDASNLSEQEILRSGVDINVDVLKVGHHGSSTSSSTAFLNAVFPEYALISVGKDNSYGHPAQDTLKRLTTVGAEIYRTDINGNICIKSNGQLYQVTFDSHINNSSSSSASSSSSSHIISTVKPTIAASTAYDPIVYITRTGEKYHSSGCQYLSKSKIPISLSDAKSNGYTPCSRCHPPQ